MEQNRASEDTEKRWRGIIRRLIDLPCAKDEEGEVTPEIIPFEEDTKARLYVCGRKSVLDYAILRLMKSL